MKTISILLTIIIISCVSCSESRHPSIDRLNELKIGMSTEQVIEILGTPRLTRNINENESILYYTHPSVTGKNIYMFFTQDSLSKIPQI